MTHPPWKVAEQGAWQTSAAGSSADASLEYGVGWGKITNEYSWCDPKDVKCKCIDLSCVRYVSVCVSVCM